MSGSETPAAKSPGRDLGFDVAKGIGILAVLVIHSSNNSARLFADRGTLEWWLLTLANRIANFGVPLFLLISAVLWTRSYARRPDPVRFYRSKFQTLVWPLAVWSLLYLLLPSLLTRTAPQPSLDWLTRTISGNASFHLYFMVILIGYAAVFPALFWLIQRLARDGASAVVGGLLLQQIVFSLNKSLFKLAAPASWFFWHLFGMWPGMWLGLNWDRFGEVWAKVRWALAFVVLGTLLRFLTAEIKVIDQVPVSSAVLNWNAKLYTFSAAFGILGLACATEFGGQRQRGWLGWLGANSFVIYLVHPIFLKGLETRRVRPFVDSLPAAPVWAFLIVLVLSILTVGIIRVLRLEGILLGQSARPKPTPPPASA